VGYTRNIHSSIVIPRSPVGHEELVSPNINERSDNACSPLWCGEDEVAVEATECIPKGIEILIILDFLQILGTVKPTS
jgi:hypothetical protein